MSSWLTHMYYSEEAAMERGCSIYKFPNGDRARVTHIFESKENAEKSISYKIYKDLIFVGTSGKLISDRSKEINICNTIIIVNDKYF